MEEIVKKAEEFMRSETEKHGAIPWFLSESAFKAGQRIAESEGADKEIVGVGTWLMDVKLPQAKTEGRVSEHVSMSVEAADDLLTKEGAAKEFKSKVLNGVAGHHGTVEWESLEAEVVANADCYKFLVVETCLRYIYGKKESQEEFEKNIKFLESKVDEKWSVLSLDVCKKELEPHYKIIKELLKLIEFS